MVILIQAMGEVHTNKFIQTLESYFKPQTYIEAIYLLGKTMILCYQNMLSEKLEKPIDFIIKHHQKHIETLTSLKWYDYHKYSMDTNSIGIGNSYQAGKKVLIEKYKPANFRPIYKFEAATEESCLYEWQLLSHRNIIEV